MIGPIGMRKAGRGGFALAVFSCLSILIALVCALAPLGLPASVTAGSAFNPATTSVVLKARAPVSARQQEATSPDGGGNGVPHIAAALGLVAALYQSAVLPGAMLKRYAFLVPHALRSAVASPVQPRAPPFPF